MQAQLVYGEKRLTFTTGVKSNAKIQQFSVRFSVRPIFIFIATPDFSTIPNYRTQKNPGHHSGKGGICNGFIGLSGRKTVKKRLFSVRFSVRVWSI